MEPAPITYTFRTSREAWAYLAGMQTAGGVGFNVVSFSVEGKRHYAVMEVGEVKPMPVGFIR